MADSRRGKKTALIMEAAERVFIRQGYNGTRMADIAREAGIGKGTLYDYFSGKRDIFFRLFETFFAQTLQVATGDPGKPAKKLAGAAGLRTFFEGCLRSMGRASRINSLFLEFWSASLVHEERHLFLEKFQTVYGEFRRTVSEIIATGVESGEFRRDLKVHRLAAALVAVFDGLLVQSWFEPRLDVKGAALVYIDCMVQGMRPLPGR